MLLVYSIKSLRVIMPSRDQNIAIDQSQPFHTPFTFVRDSIIF